MGLPGSPALRRLLLSGALGRAAFKAPSGGRGGGPWSRAGPGRRLQQRRASGPGSRGAEKTKRSRTPLGSRQGMWVGRGQGQRGSRKAARTRSPGRAPHLVIVTGPLAPARCPQGCVSTLRRPSRLPRFCCRNSPGVPRPHLGALSWGLHSRRCPAEQVPAGCGSVPAETEFGHRTGDDRELLWVRSRLSPLCCSGTI